MATSPQGTATLGNSPAHIHQILIQKPFDRESDLPPIIADNVARLKQIYPAADHRIWRHDDLRDFIANKMGPEVAAAYDKLRPFAYKADLGRLCLLHVLGGLYSDLSFFFVNAIAPPKQARIVAFLDVRASSPSWTSISNGVIWATPERPEIATAIEMILQNCRTRHYGDNPLHPTGPVLFGRAFASVLSADTGGAWNEQWVGDTRLLTPMKKTPNISYFSPAGELIAISRKRGGSNLKMLGLRGCNNYNKFWHARTVYGEVSLRGILRI